MIRKTERDERLDRLNEGFTGFFDAARMLYRREKYHFINDGADTLNALYTPQNSRFILFLFCRSQRVFSAIDRQLAITEKNGDIQHFIKEDLYALFIDRQIELSRQNRSIDPDALHTLSDMHSILNQDDPSFLSERICDLSLLPFRAEILSEENIQKELAVQKEKERQSIATASNRKDITEIVTARKRALYMKECAVNAILDQNTDPTERQYTLKSFLQTVYATSLKLDLTDYRYCDIDRYLLTHFDCNPLIQSELSLKNGNDIISYSGACDSESSLLLLNIYREERKKGLEELLLINIEKALRPFIQEEPLFDEKEYKKYHSGTTLRIRYIAQLLMSLSENLSEMNADAVFENAFLLRSLCRLFLVVCGYAHEEKEVIGSAIRQAEFCESKAFPLLTKKESELYSYTVFQLKDSYSDYSLKELLSLREVCRKEYCAAQGDAVLYDSSVYYNDILKAAAARGNRYQSLREDILNEFNEYHVTVSNTVVDSLACAESLYNQFIDTRRDSDLSDYSPISALYCLTLEEALNDLLYSRYVNVINTYEEVRDRLLSNPPLEGYFPADFTSYRAAGKNRLAEKLPFKDILHILKTAADPLKQEEINEYCGFLEIIRVDKNKLPAFAEGLDSFTGNYERSILSLNVIDKDTATEDKEKVYASSLTSLNDRDLLTKLLLLFKPEENENLLSD